MKQKFSIFYERFQDAQESERKYWLKKCKELVSEKYRQYKRNAALEIIYELQTVTNDGCLNRVLEVGGGGDPMIEYFNGETGIVIDPLAPFYKIELLPKQLSSIEYFWGIGEFLPFKTASFDGILLYNCIDHGIDPFNILEESRRVLRNGGAIHLLVDTYSLKFSVYRKLMGRIIPIYGDEKHPHCLGFNSLTKYLKYLGFVEVKKHHDAHPYSQILYKPKGSVEQFLKNMARGHRALRAFYRLEV